MGVIYWLDGVCFDARRIKSFLWGTKHRVVSCLCVMVGDILQVLAMYLRVVVVIFRWRGGCRPVSHGMREMLGFCVVRTVGDKVLLTIA